MQEEQEYVIKRDGRRQLVDLNKIRARLEKLKHRVERFSGKSMHVNVSKISRLVVSRMRNNVTTSELDQIAADTASFISDHPDYQDFAGAILASNIESNNRLSFSEYLEFAHQTVHEKTGLHSPLISDELFAIGTELADQIEEHIVRDRNMVFDYFGMQTLVKGKYLLFRYVNAEPAIFEEPQHMWMRIAIALYGRDLDQAFELYDILSTKKAIMASPTLFHAGTNFPQLSSCFLLDMKSDSISGIYDTIKHTAEISKHAGGVGFSINKIRCAGSHIASTNGTSNGIMPLLKVFNATAQYVDQGGGRRKGSFAAYISMYHADIFEFLEMRKNNGAEEMRARDLFAGLWISDLFFERAISQFKTRPASPIMWSLFDPNIAKDFDELYGDDFKQAYESLEAQKKYIRQVKIEDLWIAMCVAIIETGIPYVLAKDPCNQKSNQKNLGTIHSSNLCTEILEYTSATEVAVCNLCSLSLPAFLKADGTYDFMELYRVSRVMTRALNRIIDINFYPIPEAKLSNMRHRPVGMGVQGLGTLFLKMRTPFDSALARSTNSDIAETMYFASLKESHALAVRDGCYPSIDDNGGAPIRKGIFQQDMWKNAVPPSADLKWDWESLRADVKKDGVRNSLLIAHMPTASTSQILGNTECFEPAYSNFFTRKTKAGEFLVANSELVSQLSELGLWNTKIDSKTGKEVNATRDALIQHDGSVQNIAGIPESVKQIFRTVWEVPLGSMTDMLCDRSQYIDQSSSVNVHFQSKDNMIPQMTSYLCYAWKKGLKTLSYYTRTKQRKMVITEQNKSLQIEIAEEPACVSCSA
jgi:ribonucleoside-diphosphate reductase alpha chain